MLNEQEVQRLTQALDKVDKNLAIARALLARAVDKDTPTSAVLTAKTFKSRREALDVGLREVAAATGLSVSTCHYVETLKYVKEDNVDLIDGALAQMESH